MKLSLFPAVSLALTLSSITATRASLIPRTSTSVGAAYFITNQQSNFVVANTIWADGTVSFARAVNAYGQGSAGTPTGADPLFSQDSVKVSGSYLYAVNAGSNTVSMFKINPSDPSNLQMIGSPTYTGGDFPVSIAVSTAKNMVCVLNGGAKNGVNCFTPDPWAGLCAIDGTHRSLNLTQTTPPSGPPNTVSDIVFSPDGSKLLATVKGTPPSAPGFLAAWNIQSDGSLSSSFEPSTPAMGGVLPFSITPVKGKNAVLVTDPAAGFSIYNLAPLDVKHHVPATSTIIPVPGQKAICWSEYSPKTGNYYLSDAGASMIVEAHVDGNLQGSVVKQYALPVNSTTLDTAIASLSSNDYLYVLSAGKKTIDVFSLNSPGGATHLQGYGFDSALKNVGITVDTARLQGMAIYLKGW